MKRLQSTSANSDNTRMKKLIALLAAWASIASAQDTAVDETTVEEEPVRRYTVEIIVFSYSDDASVGSEIFLPDEPPPEEGLILDEDGNPILSRDTEIPEFGDHVVAGKGVEPGEEEDASLTWIIVPGFAEEPADEAPVLLTRGADREEPNPFQLVLLAEDEFLLGDVAEQFELLEAYETLVHFGWTQPTFEEEATPPIELQLITEPPEGLAGTLTLYLSRYLHLVVDLALDAPAEFEKEVVDEDSFFSFGDSRPDYDDRYEEQLIPIRFRIQEDRIMKNGELRYFDHPKFGVLAKVTRVEEPEEEDTGDDTGALVGRLSQ